MRKKRRGKRRPKIWYTADIDNYWWIHGIGWLCDVSDSIWETHAASSSRDYKYAKDAFNPYNYPNGETVYVLRWYYYKGTRYTREWILTGCRKETNGDKG